RAAASRGPASLGPARKRKAIDRPSGEKSGVPRWPGRWVTWRGGRAGSARSARKIWLGAPPAFERKPSRWLSGAQKGVLSDASLPGAAAVSRRGALQLAMSPIPPPAPAVRRSATKRAPREVGRPFG